MGKTNGELLRLTAASNLAVFVTTDQNVRHQQSLRAFGLAVIVLTADSNRLEHLVPLVPQLRAILASIRPGDYAEIET